MGTNDFKVAVKLAMVYSLNLLGIFLLLPVMIVYATQLDGGNVALAGFAFGCYGLMRLIMQLPLGMLSDSIGRKKIIYIGLLFVAIGSFICGYATSIEILILGRLIQGTGAVGAVVTALVADVTAEENRTKVMAIIGAAIGVSFSVSLVVSPLLADVIGVNGIFYLIGIMAFISMFVVAKMVPDPIRFSINSSKSRKIDFAKLRNVLKNTQLLRLNFGVFSLHFTQMSLFVALPLFLLDKVNLDKFHQWYIYLPSVLIGFILMVPFIIVAEKRGKLKSVMIFAVSLVLIVQLLLMFGFTNIYMIVMILSLYFIGFNILEASLPSLISKIATIDSKGTALGVYSTCQSLGLFLGGSVGGYLYQNCGIRFVYAECAVVLVIWLFLTLSMRAPKAVRTIIRSVPKHWQHRLPLFIEELHKVTGVDEIVANEQNNMLYFKVSQLFWDEEHFNSVFLKGNQ